MAALEREIIERLAALAPNQQKQVLEFVRGLDEAPKRGSGESLLRFAGALPPEDVAAMARAIEEGCENVDPHGW
ncbi:MAG TPA: hypothetical protein VFE05_15320 [Longimicrobiaceae bacterium]|jgi:hypothetical protein|nr:hypothetical protein [Longimicrobiaceae bacterium]